MTRTIPASDEIIRHLGLEPLPLEGGWFRQSYVSGELCEKHCLPPRYGGDRPFGTVIYYLLTSETGSFSALHKLKTDEVWHFYFGDPAELLLLYPDGTGKAVLLGDNILAGEQPQVCVPRGVWQGCRSVPREQGTPAAGYSLMGTSMAPGFHPDDFVLGGGKELVRRYPGFRKQIEALTRR
jgi:uncharacterized protein